MTAADTAGDPDTAPGAPQRIDKWLWFARVVKSRTLAAGLVEGGKVRLDRERLNKPSQTVRPGDVLTVTVEREVRVFKVLACGARRGPAPEARRLYEDLTPPPVPVPGGTRASHGERDFGAGRPTKRDRRQGEKLRDKQRGG